MEVIDDSQTDSLEIDSLNPLKFLKSKKSPSISDLYYQRWTPTKGSKRGRCIILNYEHFDNYQQRRGTDKDAETLRNTFASLGFDVLIHKDLSLSMTNQILDNESKLDHSKFDCFVLCILTHGKDNDVLCCRDADLTSEQIIEKFTPANCPTLAAKPKVFLIQACRGTKMDSGHLMVDAPNEPEKSEPESKAPLLRLPSHADFLVFRSTFAGYYSWRNTVNGSWFIQDLCEILNLHSNKLDLLTMMTLVCHKVAFTRESKIPIDENDDEERKLKCMQMNEKKEMPCFLSTLTKLFKFYY